MRERSLSQTPERGRQHVVDQVAENEEKEEEERRREGRGERGERGEIKFGII